MFKKLDTAVQIGVEFSNQKKTVFSHERLAIVDPTLGNNLIYQRRKSSSCCEWRNLQPPRTEKRILITNSLLSLI